MISQYALIGAGLCYFMAAFDYGWRNEILPSLAFTFWGIGNIAFSFIKGVK